MGRKAKRVRKWAGFCDSKVEGSEVAQADTEILVLQRPLMMWVILACSLRTPPQ